MSEQRTIVFPYSNHWFLRIFKTVCVFCAVPSDTLNVIYINFPPLGKTLPWFMLLVVSYRRDRVRSQLSTSDIYDEKSGARTHFSPNNSVSRVSIIPKVLYNHPPIHAGRFIMFCVITNIYNKTRKGPALTELFTATGKLKRFF
jgi:hypothetical protein